MEDLLNNLITKAQIKTGTAAFQAQVRFKGDGLTTAGAIKRSEVAGVYELLTVGEKAGAKSGVVIFFLASEIQYVGMPFVAESSNLVHP